MSVAKRMKASTVSGVVGVICVAALVVTLFMWRPHRPTTAPTPLPVTQPPPTSPTPGYLFINNNPLIPDDQATPGTENIDCGGLHGTNMEDLVVPSVEPYYFNPRGYEDVYCTFLPFQSWLQSDNPSFAATHQRDWGSSLVYQFPDSFGWGGALWTVWDGSSELGYNPAQPEAADSVQAVLCDAASNCLWMNLHTVGADVLKPNVNGLVDPIGSALMALDAAWRNLRVEHPDLGLAVLPDVNPSPYVPITTPVDFGPNTPGGTPTASPSPSSGATPGGGPS